MPTAVVTGAAQRIGRAICIWLAKNQWDIIAHYNSSHEEAVALQGEVQSLYGVKVGLVQADFVSTSEPVCEMIEKDEAITLLINNAALFQNDNSMDLKRTEEHFAVNLFAPMALSQCFANCIKKRQKRGENAFGSIINILDYAVLAHAQASFTSYILSKKALWDYTKIAALQLAKYTKVNAIGPYQVLYNPAQPYENYQKAMSHLLLPQKNDIVELLHALQFIIENKNFTGQMVTLDGGRHLASHLYL